MIPQSLILSDKKRKQPAMSEALQRFKVIDEQLSAIERSAGTVASEIEGSRQVKRERERERGRREREREEEREGERERDSPKTLTHSK